MQITFVPLEYPIKSDLSVIAKMTQSAQSVCLAMGMQWHLRCSRVAEPSRLAGRYDTRAIRDPGPARAIAGAARTILEHLIYHQAPLYRQVS